MKTKNQTTTLASRSIQPLPLGSGAAFARWVTLLVGCAGLLSLPAYGALKTWVAPVGNGNWGTSGNWSPSGAPAAGDDLSFPAGAVQLVTTNNLTRNFSSIAFSGAGGGYVLRGNPLTLTNGLTAAHTVSINAVELTITNGASQTITATTGGTLAMNGDIVFNGFNLTVNNTVAVNLAGVLSGTGNLIKNGAGNLLLNGAVNNTYTGTTTVNNGTLELNDTSAATAMVPGNLVINTLGTVLLTEGSQIADTANVTINGAGVFNLNGWPETIGNNLTFTSGGSVALGAGTLTLGASSTINVTSSGSVSGSGYLNIGSGTCTIQGSGNLLLYANVSGSANIVKNGTVALYLYGANTFTGSLTANTGGFVYVLNSLALGATSGGTVINDSAYLAMTGDLNVTNEPLTMNSSSPYAIDIVGASTNVWTGTFTFNADTWIDVETNCALNLLGPIGGAGGVIKTAPGRLIYSGDSDNFYSGNTLVQQGTLELNKSSFWWAIKFGTLTIGDGTGGSHADVVRYTGTGSDQMYNLVSVVVASSGLLDLNGHSDIIGSSVTLKDGDITTGAGTLTLYNNPTITVSNSPSITGNLNVGSGTCTIQGNGILYLYANVAGPANIVKNGAGSIHIYGANTFTGTLTANTSGYLYVLNPLALGATNGGTFINDSAFIAMTGNHNVTNESLTMNSSYPNAIYILGVSTNIWIGAFTNNADTWVYPDTSCSLDLVGPISGAGGITKWGAGTLKYSGGTANTYTGPTIVTRGTLELGKTVTDGGIKFGSLTITNATVRENNNYQIGSIPVTVLQGGLLDLDGFLDTIGYNLNLTNGTVQTGAGTLYLLSPNTISCADYNNFIYGKLNVGSSTSTLQGTELLYLYADVSGSANIIKNGNMGLWLSGDNTFTGTLTVNTAGSLYLADNHALGGTNNGTILNGSAYINIYPGINITNESLTLNSTRTSAIYNISNNTNTWTATNFTLSADTAVFVATNSLLEFKGPMSGPGGVTKYGPGRLLYSGAGNTYDGLTTVNEGELDLAKTSGYAISSYGAGLIIGDGVGADTVRNYAGQQIWGLAPMTITTSGTWDLNNYIDSADPLTLNGGQIFTGTGLCAMINTVKVGSDSSVYGKVRLDTSSVVFSNTTTTSTLNMYAAVSGYSASYGLAKAGGGNLYLTSSNSYGGLTAVRQGKLWVENDWALGTTASGTVVSNGASLVLKGGIAVTNESLTLNGPGVDSNYGALDSKTQSGFEGADLWVGPITLNTDSSIDTWNSDDLLRIIGPISGPGALTQFGWGTLSLEGVVANTYAGVTTVGLDSTLVLANTGGINVPGNLVLAGSGSVVRLGNSEAIANTADVLVNAGGLFDLGIYHESINTLRGLGTVNFGAGSWFSIGGGNGSSEFDGPFTGTGYASGYTVGKFGTGTFTMGGNSSYTAGITHVYNGKLVINGSQPLIPVMVDTIATLGGSGVVNTIAGNGTISPGTSPGILNSSNVTFSATGNYAVELTGPNPGSGYDQLNVTGTVALANAALTVVPAFTTPVSIGQQFTIIKNDSTETVTGTFNGLAEGSLFSAGGYSFRVSYSGGTGNDVVLTLWGVPGNTVTVNAVDRGWYDSTGFHDSTSQNYLAGENGGSTNTFRNWFVFNMPVFSGSIIHAELIVNCYSNLSPYGQETYLLRKVATPIATLQAGGSGLVGVYNDLGTGAVYSARSIAVNESYQKAIIPLNAAFINAAAAAAGSQLAVGGSLGTFDTTNHNQWLFGFSASAAADDVQLRLTIGTSVVINSANRGWFNNSGNHTASNPNYLVGNDSIGAYRNFFVFNLPAVSSQLVDAQLLVNSFTNTSPDGVETYQLYDVTTAIAALTNGWSGATGIYDDLGTGEVYGGRDVYVSESGLISSIPLNGNFLAAALANSGGKIALGGALTSLDPLLNTEKLFNFSTASTAADVQLWLGFLNAPSVRPSFVSWATTYLGNDRVQFTVAGTAGTTNEIQGSFDFQRWDFIRDLKMTGATTSFIHTNTTTVHYRFFRAEQLQ